MSGKTHIPFFARVRVQLAILLSLIFIPAMILTIRASLNQQRIEKDRVRQEAVALAKLCVAKYQTFSETARQLLLSVSQARFLVLASDSAVSRIHFANLCKLMPEYIDFGLVEANGTLFASSSNANLHTSLTNWSCYQRVMATKRFSIGDLDTNGPLGGVTFDLGYPIFDDHGELNRILYASLKLEELRKVTGNILLPPETTIRLHDRRGVLLASFPGEKGERTNELDHSFAGLIQQNETVFERRDTDGIDKLFALAFLEDANDTALIVTVSIPTTTSFAAANYVLWKNISFLTVVFLIVLVAAYFYSEHFLLRPLQRLMESARQLGANEVRATNESLIRNAGELGELARTFDQMAKTLEERRKQVQVSHQQVQQLNGELEKRVQERTAELAAANRELERFSYSVSHDLRAPLRAMQSFASILKDDFSSEMSAEAIDFLDRISRAAVRLDCLTTDILAYSRVAALQLPLEPVDLNELVVDLLHTYPNLSGARLDVQRLPLVTGQKSYLTQCFSNLVANAVKFVPSDREPQIKIWSQTTDGVARIWVEDNGIGIAPEHQSRIFEMFERLEPHRGFEGTGIGLAIVRAAVERMSGKVGFESELGKGSRFWVELAVANGEVKKTSLKAI